MAAGLSRHRIAVVGAGLAGLSAGWELTRLGFEVEIFERSRLVGGKATSFEVAGSEVDNGQHVFLGCFEEWLRLAGAAGMAGQLHLQERFEVLLLAPGRATRLRAADWPAPLHLLPALAGHRLLGLGGRLQVARAMLAARRPARPGETAAAWLARLGQGERARAAFWDPFLVPALNAPLDEVDAEAARVVITTAFLAGPEACRIGWSKVPLARIAEAVAERAGRLRLRTPVSGLETAGRQVTAVRTAGGAVPVAGAVLAVPPHQLHRLLPAEAGIRLDGFASRPIVDVHLWYDAGRLELGHGLDFAALVGSPVQWVFRKRPGYLCCSLSSAADLVGRPEQELVDLCHRELSAVLPGLRELRPVEGRATRDPQATFVPAPGLRRPGPVTGLPNLVLAGAWTDTGLPATMESAVRSGRTAARAMAAHLDRLPALRAAPEVAAS
jgi:squalene-associated FAD-dependent desaturase